MRAHPGRCRRAQRHDPHGRPFSDPRALRLARCERCRDPRRPPRRRHKRGAAESAQDVRRHAGPVGRGGAAGRRSQRARCDPRRPRRTDFGRPDADQQRFFARRWKLYVGAARLRGRRFDSRPVVICANLAGSSGVSRADAIARTRAAQAYSGDAGRTRYRDGRGRRRDAYDHHDCHLASAYYASGEPDCLVVSNDGFGDALCCKVALGHGGRLDVISSNSFFNSLGVYYNYASLLCGFPKAHHVGKTTGLAAFGDPTRTIDTFRKLARWDEGQGRYVNDGPVFRRAIYALQSELATVRREDIAAGVQRHAEDVLIAMVRHFMRKTGRKRILLVGGVHANVKVNQRIAEIEGVERVAVFPNMGDGGLAAGAAWLAWAEKNQPGELPPRLADVYLGPQPPSEHELSGCLQAAGLAVTRPPDLPQAVAESLAAGKIVARFDGRMEYGPRALGNRSILYAATDASVNTWLNHQLKRTEFMPFAPVVRAEDASDFLANLTASSAYTAQFMTITYDVTKRCRLEAPAVVHVDGTARPQVIHREVNPGYYDILTAYQRVTGLSVLVNTSFNMHEEPIVCSLQDAIRSFLTSSVDVLAAGPFLIDSPVQPPARVSAAGQASR